MTNSLVLLTMWGILAGGILLNEFTDFVLLSYYLASSHDIPVDSCDKINGLLYEFNSSMGSLSRETHSDMSSIHIDVSNDNWDKFIKYWLYGTATEINWFDKSCQVGWDYLKASCSITPVANNSHDGCLTIGKEFLVTANNKANCLILGLGCLLIVSVLFVDIYYNLDILKAVYTSVDLHLYKTLCMFDFPGFMVNKTSFMHLIPGFDLWAEHFWSIRTDPLDGVSRLVHLALYTLHHEYFFLTFVSLSPSWSVPSSLQLTVRPGWDWPFNYDHLFHITLFEFF